MYTNNLYTYKQLNCLSSPDVKYVLHNIHKGFVVVPGDNATRNIVIVCKRFGAFSSKESGLSNNSSTGNYNKINNPKT